eukprot:343587-Chlamydomonas_euryale.AAC.1
MPPLFPTAGTRSGTPAYMAPELVMQAYDEKCDIWSVGMLTYQLLTGRFPFWEDVRKETLTDVWRAVLTQNISWKAKELQQVGPQYGLAWADGEGGSEGEEGRGGTLLSREKGRE